MPNRTPQYNFERLNLRSKDTDKDRSFNVPPLMQTLGNLTVYLSTAHQLQTGQNYPTPLLTAYDKLNGIISRVSGVGYSNYHIRQELGLHASTILASEALEAMECDHLVFNTLGYTGILAAQPKDQTGKSLLILTEHGDPNHGKLLSDVLPRANQPWIINSAQTYGEVNIVVGQKAGEWISPGALHYDHLAAVQVMAPEFGRKTLEATGNPGTPMPQLGLPMPENALRYGLPIAPRATALA